MVRVLLLLPILGCSTGSVGYRAGTDTQPGDPDGGGDYATAGDPGDAVAPSDPSTGDPLPSGDPSPAVVWQVTFDAAPVGAYDRTTMDLEWPGVRWASGLTEGRVHIIDDANAHSGHSLRIYYPLGGVGPGEGGAQWMVDFAESYQELYCAYWIRFGTGFDFVRGGKIPGLVGGAANTGGDKPDGTDGWSARMMWRTGGNAVQYLYHPDQPSTWGEDLNWDIGGQRVFAPGTWVQVEHRIVMNTPTQPDGIVQGWWNGELALDHQDIRFRDVDTFAIDGFYFSTFFGGSDATWAATANEYVYFDDFVISRQPITH